MAGLYSTDKGILLHLEAENIYRLIITRVKGGGRNFYGVYDLIHNNKLPITETLAMTVIDRIKEGQICDIEHSFNWDDELFFK